MAIEQSDIDAAALEPKLVEGDQGKFENRPIAELLEAQRATAGVTASTRGHRGIRFTQLIPEGTESGRAV